MIASRFPPVGELDLRGGLVLVQRDGAREGGSDVLLAATVVLVALQLHHVVHTHSNMFFSSPAKKHSVYKAISNSGEVPIILEETFFKQPFH